MKKSAGNVINRLSSRFVIVGRQMSRGSDGEGDVFFAVPLAIRFGEGEGGRRLLIRRRIQISPRRGRVNGRGKG